MAPIPVARVQDIPIADIGPNPHNPRRLFDEEPMRVLKESVRKLGILVPVTLYEESQQHGPGALQYVLLDGERRWRCAKELGLSTVPAIVVEKPSDTQNILTMFHIHNVREGWQLMPTALKLRTLMSELNETNERKLHELTKLSIAQIRRCKILLTYPRRFQEMMLAPPTERMKADFFIELDRIRRPALRDRLPAWIKRRDPTVIASLLAKYQDGIIENVTDFRHLAAVFQASRSEKQKQRLNREFGRFVDRHEVTIDAIRVPGASFAREAKEVQRSARRLSTQLRGLDPAVIASDESTVKELRALLRLLNKKLEQGLLLETRNAASDDD